MLSYLVYYRRIGVEMMIYKLLLLYTPVERVLTGYTAMPKKRPRHGVEAPYCLMRKKLPETPPDA